MQFFRFEPMKNVLLFSILITAFQLFAQSDNYRFRQYAKNHQETITPFALPNEGRPTLQFLEEWKIPVKYITKEWIYVSMTPAAIEKALKEKKIQHFHFEFAPPALLTDSARIAQKVDEVHRGDSPLHHGYTGKNVLIGYVDQGIDWNHPDFRDENDKPRVIRYWDHTAPTNSNSPQPYGYGQVCDSISIINGTCPLTEFGTYHGSTVAGAGSGNGRANGKNKGMAPDSKIIAVETNFNLQNWTLSVADACDYIFKVADTLGIPAVVNLSVGSYYGSHDGRDPASARMEALLDEKPGRIIVCAAGNSGKNGKYHVRGTNNGGDTSFVWLTSNPSNQVAPNSVFFELWADKSDFTNIQFAFKGLESTTLHSGNYTSFRPPFNTSSPVIDTIKGVNGNKLAIAETYCELINNTYHLEVLIRNIDSLNHYYEFATRGTGRYDIWSGSWSNLNDFVTQLPSEHVYPSISKYNNPDSLQTLVSSWACSDKVITVGNIRNRLTHLNNNGTYHPNNDPTPVGTISPGSSRGPSRQGSMKPDIVASGDLMMAAAPLFMRADPMYNSALEPGGWHARNGGTSMASPVVAGIAALYLEKCNNFTYADFKRDIRLTATEDAVTGTIPNYIYGYGKTNAFKLLVENGQVLGDSVFCEVGLLQTAVVGAHTVDSVRWGQTSTSVNPFLINASGNYEFEIYFENRCYSHIRKTIEEGIRPDTPQISINGNILSSSPADNYQWYHNGNPIPGANASTCVITEGGSYVVSTTGESGCTSYSWPYISSLSVDEPEDNKEIRVYPNPTPGEFLIAGLKEGDLVKLYDINGKEIPVHHFNSAFNISSLAQGVYILSIQRNFEFRHIKIIRK